jgi:hypothetical protein
MGLVWTIVGLITGLSALAFIELAKRMRRHLPLRQT